MKCLMFISVFTNPHVELEFLMGDWVEVGTKYF